MSKEYFIEKVMLEFKEFCKDNTECNINNIIIDYNSFIDVENIYNEYVKDKYLNFFVKFKYDSTLYRTKRFFATYYFLYENILRILYMYEDYLDIIEKIIPLSRIKLIVKDTVTHISYERYYIEIDSASLERIDVKCLNEDYNIHDFFTQLNKVI